MGFTYVSKYDYSWSTVTLCPWFIVCLPHSPSQKSFFLLIGRANQNYAQDAGFPQCGTFGEKFKGLAARALDGIVTSISYTPIDLFSLFDKVIVHEVWILSLPFSLFCESSSRSLPSPDTSTSLPTPERGAKRGTRRWIRMVTMAYAMPPTVRSNPHSPPFSVYGPYLMHTP